MNNRPIQKGDLVMVVKDCCGRYVGSIFRVGAVIHISQPMWLLCHVCNHGYSNIDVAQSDSANTLVLNSSIHWLKRIDPGLLTEDIPEREEINA